MAQVIFWGSMFPIQKTRGIGCYQLAHHLRKNKISAQVIDYCGLFGAEELISITEKFITTETIVLGVSTSFWINIGKEFTKALGIFKEKFKKIKIIFGGPRANNPNYKIFYDLAFVGEAENTFIEYLFEKLDRDKSTIIPFDITTLDHRFVQEDCILEGEVLPIELGRGCIFKCKFCSHTNLGKPKHTYQRNSQLIYEEMKYNLENFKTTHYLFLDDTVNEDLEKVKNLANINQRLGNILVWNGYLRLDLLWSNKDSYKYLLDSGLKSCFFGIETFDPKASMVIGKGWNGKYAKTFLSELHDNLWNKQINIQNSFIIGLPYETPDGVDQTVEWCLKNPFGLHHFNELTLYHNRNDSGSTSEFSRNYGLYGYKIDSKGKYYNKYWTSDSVATKVKEIKKIMLKVNRLTSWMLFNEYNVTRQPIDILRTKPEYSKSLASVYTLKLKYKKLLEDVSV
jgi:radical SAM superfamily enzyme YgiQ (UPF0313 family)